MALKKPKMDWTKLREATQRNQDIEAAERELKSLDGRGLYTLNFVSQMPDLLINRPVNKAMHRTMINYPVKPVDIMRDCLIDGNVVLEVGDAEHVSIQKYVTRLNYNPFTNELDFIEIKYQFSAGVGAQEMWHIEHWTKFSDGTAWFVQFKPTREEIDEKRWVVDFEFALPIFPFIGIPWVEQESFLKKPKDAIIRLELAYRVIGVENAERMGLQLYIEGVRSADDIKTAPRRMGRRTHLLPPDSKFHSPASDAPGMELMIVEIEKLEGAIEAATGVVTTEKLATLSGISRVIAEEPLIILAEEIRDRFTRGMEEVAELAKHMGTAPPLKIKYRPLRHVESAVDKLLLLDKAVEKKAITSEEYGEGLRELLNLPSTTE